MSVTFFVAELSGGGCSHGDFDLEIGSELSPQGADIKL